MVVPEMAVTLPSFPKGAWPRVLGWSVAAVLPVDALFWLVVAEAAVCACVCMAIVPAAPAITNPRPLNSTAIFLDIVIDLYLMFNLVYIDIITTPPHAE